MSEHEPYPSADVWALLLTASGAIGCMTAVARILREQDQPQLAETVHNTANKLQAAVDKVMP